MSSGAEGSASACRLGVLLSGRGSNFKAIEAAVSRGEIPGATIVLVLSNRAEAEGLQFASSRGLPTSVVALKNFPDRPAFDQAIADALKLARVDLIVLAGYDRIIGAALLNGWPGRILNIHPSLLPAYGGKGMLGMNVHRAVLANGEAESGCSVHLVTDVVDGGEVLGQSRVPVHPGDTPESLAERVLHEEHQLYPRMIREFIERRFANASTKSHEDGIHA